jgi:hypothetical protein
VTKCWTPFGRFTLEGRSNLEGFTLTKELNNATIIPIKKLPRAIEELSIPLSLPTSKTGGSSQLGRETSDGHSQPHDS